MFWKLVFKTSRPGAAGQIGAGWVKAFISVVRSEGVCEAFGMPNQHSPSSPLAGWYVISLRPLGQHVNLRRAAERRKARVFAISTLRLSALDAGTALNQALAAPEVIATSPAAVRFAASQRPLRQRRGQRWYALGEGTANALRHVGIDRITRSDRGADSEGLLARPELQAVRDRSVGLLTALGGRDLIAQTLAKRGARVLRADVYRRLPLPLPSHRRQALAALPPHSALLISSAEALAVLWNALDAVDRLALCQRLAVASSERLCAHLRALGFARVVRADSASASALLDALAAHVGGGRFR
jgi:uroporphyrinogen-III synthase